VIIKKAAVMGGGAMGGSIAHLLSAAGMECFIKDIDQKFVDKALSQSQGIYAKLVAKRKIDKAKAESGQALLKGGVVYDGAYFKDVDLIIEAVPEILKLKQEIYAELDKLCPEKTIFATNTSTLSLTEIAALVSRKDRCVGLHFFNPAHVMKLVEVIYDENTAGDTIDAMMKISLALGKVPIKVKNAPGFVVNRILIPYMNEAVLAIMDGAASVEEIDKAMTDFGMPMGPFALWDLIGLDVGSHASQTLADAFGARTPLPELLQTMVDKGMFGQKSGKGFYDYTSPEKQPAVGVVELLEKWWKDNPIKGEDFFPDRLLAVQIRECLLIVNEGIASAHDVDTGMVFGTNFPTQVAYGPLHYAEEHTGWVEVVAMADYLAVELGPERFTLPKNTENLVRGESIFQNCWYEIDQDGVAVMIVENPPMNILSEKTVNDITSTMLQAAADPRVRAIVLTGKGRAFIAGADIKEFQQIRTHSQVHEFCARGHRMTNVIERADKPVICAINGFCLGGGLEVAMACHLRIAADSARLGLPEINLGIIPGFAGTQRLARIVGKGKALEMILTGGHLNAKEAYEIGLVNKVSPGASLIDEARNLARVIAKKGRLAVVAAMHSISEGLETSFEEGCAREIENFARVKVSHDAMEGVDAFLTKREAKFRDR
jgi:enoyl-CoA hydratase/3-hydroxyacyl-CoA dehydrogenase